MPKKQKPFLELYPNWPILCDTKLIDLWFFIGRYGRPRKRPRPQRRLRWLGRVIRMAITMAAAASIEKLDCTQNVVNELQARPPRALQLELGPLSSPGSIDVPIIPERSPRPCPRDSSRDRHGIASPSQYRSWRSTSLMKRFIDQP